MKTKKIQIIKETLKHSCWYHVKLDNKLIHSCDDFAEAMLEYERIRDEEASRSRMRVMIEEEI
jgi:hypothetical protein